MSQSSAPPGAVDWGELYREHVADLAAMAAGLSDAEVASTVLGTPEWDVRQVYAHLAGGPVDSARGTTDGAPGPEWTARHVAERDGVPLADLVAELQGVVDGVVAALPDMVATGFPGVVWDIATHHADLHETLGRGRIGPHLYLPIVESLGRRRAPDLVDQVDPYELFRGLFSRRSRAQMAAWGTSATPEELDAVCVFGPRDDDQPQPGPRS